MDTKRTEVTRLLLAWSRGDETVLDRLLLLVEHELRRMARGFMASERPDHSLQPTELVNELCIRLLGRDSVSWRNRAHFVGTAAGLMRRILVDHARRRQRQKRGEGVKPLPLDKLHDFIEPRDQEIIDLDDGLLSLSKLHSRQARAIELRYFGNLTDEEIGEIAGVSPATVRRDLKAAKAWLRREIRTAPASRIASGPAEDTQP